MKKVIYILLGLVIVVMIIIASFDSLGKKYAQEYARNLLKTPVTISQFDSDFFNKSLNIDFVEVQNPPDFNNKNALSLEHFVLRIGDISDDLFVIENLSLSGLEFTLEQKGAKVNLSQLLDNLDTLEPTNTDTSDNSSTSTDMRIKIKKFKVSEITLKVVLGQVKTTLNVADISAHNFGGNTGVRADEMGEEIAREILQNLKKALEKQGIEIGKKKIKQTLMRKLGDKLGIDNPAKKNDFDNLKKGVEDKLKDTFKKFGF